MSLTPAQRAEQNRRNAQNPPVPRPSKAKHVARECVKARPTRSKSFPCPAKIPRSRPRRAAAWHDYYQPQSPAVHHLVNECARATLFADRLAALSYVDRHRTNARRPTRLACRPFGRDRPAHRTPPQQQESRRRARGPPRNGRRLAFICWTAGFRSSIASSIAGFGNPATSPRPFALLGGIKANPDAWVVRVFACLIGLHKNASLLAKLFQPDRQPPSLRQHLHSQQFTQLRRRLPMARNWRVAAEITMLRPRHWELDRRHQPRWPMPPSADSCAGPGDCTLASPLSQRGPQRLSARLQNPALDP